MAKKWRIKASGTKSVQVAFSRKSIDVSISNFEWPENQKMPNI
jgi:hypothetical protein